MTLATHRRLFALGALWAIVTLAMLIAPGCYGRNCDGTSGTYGREPGEGAMIDEDTWESTPIDGKWLHFSSGHTWFFDVPAFGERKPFKIQTYISPIEEPNVYGAGKPSGNFSEGGGNLTELSGVDKNRLVVRNGTCAEYFLRVVVELPPKPTGVIAPADVDASADASDAAGASDASDASTDGEAGP